MIDNSNNREEEQFSFSDITNEKRAEYYKGFNELLHIMFDKETWEVRFGKRKSLRIMSLCLFYQTITVRQILELRISSFPKEESENIYMRRLVDKKLFSSDRVQLENLKEIAIYTLTIQGAAYYVGELKKLLLIDPDFFPEAITEECLDYLYYRYIHMAKRKNIKHFTELYNTNIYLLANPHIKEYYFELETLVTNLGTVMPLADKLKYVNSSYKSNSKLKSDAYFAYESLENKFNVYVEQDMSTQRTNILYSKMLRYNEHVFCNATGAEVHTLLFSLYTPLKQLSSATRRARGAELELVSKSNLNYVRLAISSASLYSQYNSHDDSIPLEDYELERIYKILVDTIEQIKDSPLLMEYRKFYMNACEYILEYVETLPGATLRDLIEGTRDEISSSAQRLKEDENKRLVNAFANRRQLILTAALSDHVLDEQLKRGNSICTSSSRLLSYTVPNILVGLGGIENRVYTLMSYCGYLKNMADSYTYAPFTFTYNKDGYVLRNHFTFGEKHFYVENISDDIGGYVRVKEYMNTLQFSAEPGVLLCLISSDEKAYELSTSLWKDSLYAATVVTKVPITKEVPLEVLYITYENFEIGRDAYVFDEDMNLHAIELWGRVNE